MTLINTRSLACLYIFFSSKYFDFNLSRMDKSCLSWYLTNDQSFVLICEFCNKILEEFRA